MQIKTKLRFHLLFLEWLPSRTQKSTNVGKYVEEKGTLIYLQWGYKLVQTTMENNMEVSLKLKMQLP
jgi:hypothetical protein